MSKVIWQKAASLPCRPHGSECIYSLFSRHVLRARDRHIRQRRQVNSANSLTCVGTLQWAGTCPLRQCPIPRGSESPSNIWFLGSHESVRLNGNSYCISINSVIFAFAQHKQAHRQADIHTYRPRYV